MPTTRLPDVQDIGLINPSFFSIDEAAGDPARLLSLGQVLLARPLPDVASLRAWLRDWDDVSRLVWGHWGRVTLAMNRDTRDEALAAQHASLQPALVQPWFELADQLNARYLDHPLRDQVGDDLAILDARKQSQRDIYHAPNGPLFTRLSELAANYQRRMGETCVVLDGEAVPLSMARRKVNDPDRRVRESAWRAIGAAQASLAADVSGILDEMVVLRDQVATNAGYPDFVAYHFAASGRTDYSPDDIERFSAEIAAVVVPRLQRLSERRRLRLGVDTLRPWDMPAPIIPSPSAEEAALFSSEAELFELTAQIMGDIDPRLQADFRVLQRHGLIDLMTRPGKAPGGYCMTVDDIGMPFIFANLTGDWRDLQVLFHEGGHALHALACRTQPFGEYRNPAAEFCEVASMGLELLAQERSSSLPASVSRALELQQLSGVFGLFLQVALVDGLQLWMYRNPDQGGAVRQQRWAERHARLFGTSTDWSGFEETRAVTWATIPHFFTHPLYFIEYGIAQLGALQLWQRARRDMSGTVDRYRSALALGGSRSLSELFTAAGLTFSMEGALLAELLDEVLDVIEQSLAAP
ncbi:MAG: M3 family metallopeptidase [Myxococcota bacterium]